jgi:hypothetical protein
MSNPHKRGIGIKSLGQHYRATYRETQIEVFSHEFLRWIWTKVKGHVLFLVSLTKRCTSVAEKTVRDGSTGMREFDDSPFVDMTVVAKAPETVKKQFLELWRSSSIQLFL